jgi:peroxiredoxin
MNIFKTLLCLSFLTISTFSFSQDGLKKLPDVEVKTLNGQTVNLADYGKDGKITIISFWATWCTPCKKELDALADFYPDWKEEYDCELLAITIDNSRQLAKVPVMVETKQWEYTILAGDQNAVQTAFNFQTIPQTFVIDKEGNIAYTHSGYVPGNEYELEDVVKKLAGK